MNAIPETSTTLLKDIACDSRHARWGEFVARYRPMMEAFMRERFPTVEADDVIQETFVALCGILPNYAYEPDEKGHFRNYLTGILRNKALRVLRKERRQAEIAEMAGAGAPLVHGRMAIARAIRWRLLSVNARMPLAWAGDCRLKRKWLPAHGRVRMRKGCRLLLTGRLRVGSRVGRNARTHWGCTMSMETFPNGCGFRPN